MLSNPSLIKNDNRGNLFLGPPPKHPLRGTHITVSQRASSANNDAQGPPSTEESPVSKSGPAKLTKSGTTSGIPERSPQSPNSPSEPLSKPTTSTTTPAPKASGLGPRATRSLSHDAVTAPTSSAKASATSESGPTSSRPVVPHRLRHRSQSTSQSAEKSTAGSSAVGATKNDPSTKIEPSKQAKTKRPRRSGTSSTGFLLGLGGYDPLEHRQHINPPVPAIPASATATGDAHIAKTSAPETMPSGVKSLGKQPKGSGSGSSLLFGPAKTSTSSSFSSALDPSSSSASPADLAPKSPGASRLRSGSITTAPSSAALSSPHPPSQYSGSRTDQPVFRHEGGRRWLRDQTLPYPLPVDLEELHRQSLRLVMQMRLFGRPFLNEAFLATAEEQLQQQQQKSTGGRRASEVGKLGSKGPPPPPKEPRSPSKPSLRQNPPTPRGPPKRPGPLRILEVACGAGLWSSASHDYLSRKGIRDVQFTGMDIAPLAPDLRKQGGVNWRFVQWDVRRLPWPFEDGEFDFIFVKDTTFTMSSIRSSSTPMPETARILRSGGIVEVWESDHVFRTLLPNPQLPPGTSAEQARQAESCGAHMINASTPFAPAQNKILTELNAWMTDALVKRDLPPSPCGLAEWALRADPDTFTDIGSWRLALPFDETRWETKAGRVLSPDQRALRRTALLTTLQFVAGLERILRQSSEKRQDEWNRWWSAGLRDLLEDKGTFGGECLELGAWWATRA